MELSNINNDKRHEEDTGFKTGHTLSPEEENRRAEAMAAIFHTEADNHHYDFYSRAGENGTNVVDSNKLHVPDDTAMSLRASSDNRSEFGGIAESIPDVNIYQNKKTVAQGMMDLALFSANANQLRYVLESVNHPYYYSGIVLIAISLIFQVAVGVGLLINTRYSVKCRKEICIANRINNFTIIGIFLVTVINVFISAFGVATNGTAVSTIPALSNRFGEEDNITETTTMPADME
ncbi:hypothetical protein AMK59_4886 [Oryctes borbonicus]|uniref:Uncharacterized protein n=1 Tax=Oryctes borbonicus TaxID=1629725 RepID=A0A0T6B7K8_9SCAR|nr:hypothetical protein AMK59_4886 [Oryctes borbonicus]